MRVLFDGSKHTVQFLFAVKTANPFFSVVVQHDKIGESTEDLALIKALCDSQTLVNALYTDQGDVVAIAQQIRADI